jgi:hypothetical protein
MIPTECAPELSVRGQTEFTAPARAARVPRALFAARIVVGREAIPVRENGMNVRKLTAEEPRVSY